jgi:hypothetical protein
MQRYTLYLYLETALHVSVGTSTHHQERIQLYLQNLVFVTPLHGPLSAENPAWSSDTHSYVLRCHEQLEVATEDKHTVFLVSYFCGNLLSGFEILWCWFFFWVDSLLEYSFLL